VTVKVGDTVNAGDTVLLMEAMKMENNITAETDGTVKAILVQQGAQVQSGDALIEMA
jgi:biotin carboxyl carrier protein